MRQDTANVASKSQFSPTLLMDLWFSATYQRIILTILFATSTVGSFYHAQEINSNILSFLIVVNTILCCPDAAYFRTQHFLITENKKVRCHCIHDPDGVCLCGIEEHMGFYFSFFIFWCAGKFYGDEDEHLVVNQQSKNLLGGQWTKLSLDNYQFERKYDILIAFQQPRLDFLSKNSTNMHIRFLIQIREHLFPCTRTKIDL